MDETLFFFFVNLKCNFIGQLGQDGDVSDRRRGLQRPAHPSVRRGQRPTRAQQGIPILIRKYLLSREGTAKQQYQVMQ